MRSRCVLYLDEQKLTAYRWQAGSVACEGIFTADAAGQANFAAFLRRHSRQRFTLLANLGDETYHTITLPRLPFHERRLVIERKLAQHFHACRLVAAASLGQPNGTRRDESVLLAALDTRSRMAPWIEAVTDAGTLLCSVHSLPFVAAQLVSRLLPPRFSGLLLTLQDDSLRETYFDSGSLRFSRRVPADGLHGSELAQLIALESARLRHYLGTQQLIDTESALRCLVIVGPDDLADVRSHCVDTAMITFDLRTGDDCAQYIGLKQRPEGNRIDAAFVHLLSASPPATQFADYGLRRQYRTQRLRTAIFAGAVVILTIGLSLAGERWIETRQYETETARLVAEASELRQRAIGYGATIPAIPITADALRQVVVRHDELMAEENLPNDFLAEVANALDRSPAIAIKRLSWSGASPFPAMAADRRQHLVLHGVVAPPSDIAGNSRQILHSFIAHLRESPRLKVGIGKLIPSVAAERGDDRVDAVSQSRQFTLELTREMP